MHTFLPNINTTQHISFIFQPVSTMLMVYTAELAAVDLRSDLISSQIRSGREQRLKVLLLMLELLHRHLEIFRLQGCQSATSSRPFKK